MKRTADISDFLQPLRDKPFQAYLSNALQVADVLDWVLQQLGKSEVWQTSFSISEEFIRRLFFIEKSGLVTKFNLVLDHKATNKTLKLWAFITQVINTTYLADNHSKVLLVRSQKGEVVIIISQDRPGRCSATNARSLNPLSASPYLPTFSIMAEMVGDTISSSYSRFVRNYLMALVEFVAGNSVKDIQLIPDDVYKDATSTRIRMEVIDLLKQYGMKDDSKKLADAIQEYKESMPMLSRLARLIQTANAMQDTLSGSALNVIKREIIKTLSIETENDADLEAASGTYLGIESGTQEFKTSIIFPSNNNMQPDEYAQNMNVLKGVCAFLNSTTGGVLYLGVNDQGYVTGVENDMKYLNQSSIDSYLRYIQDTAKKHFGVDTLPYLRIEQLYDNQEVAIHVDPHPYRVVELNNTAYLRVNAESRKMPEAMRQQLIASKVFTKKNQAAAISLLQHACSQRKRVVLHNYASSNSGKVADRTVEAYDVKPEDGLVMCYDRKKLKNGVFKINRISYVEILENESWAHTASHKKIDVDAFHMSGTKPIPVSLQLDLFAKNLLVEEFPSSKEFIKPHKGDDNIWYFDTDVYQIEGVARFYIGLANHIKILNAPELEKFVASFARDNLQYSL